MPKSSSYRYLAALLTAQLACTGLLCAFEQGSYYVFDLVETDAAEPIMGRIPVPAKAITAEAIETANTLPETRSEFEIDYNKTMRSTTTSGFELTAPLDLENEAESESVSFSSEAFDFGNSTTVFGE